MDALNRMRRIAAGIGLIILFFTAGCQSVTPVPSTQTISPFDPTPRFTQPAANTHPDPTEAAVNPDPTNAEVPQSTPIQPTTEPTAAPTLSDWRTAPISPESISDRVLEIYRAGQALGRDPHSFSVIGDCQSIPYVFMGPFSRGELEPKPEERQLWKAINAFDASFKRWGVTARGGFTAASILNPLQADVELCKPGETPLTCEFRLNNPAFVLITLETWLDPDSIDRYEVYLRHILDTVIAQGAVPILLTKADSSELRNGEHIINPVIVRVAYEYQLPLVNFWRAAQYLDNYGIDPEREGFHLSKAGYDLKNILALRALYQVWTTVEGGETADAPTEVAPTPSITPEPTPDDILEITIPDCDNGCIFFGTAISRDGTVVGGGVYAYNVEQQVLTQVLPEGFDLQDVTDDGSKLLVNKENKLYILDLDSNTTNLISETLIFTGKQGAYWDENDQEVIFLNQDHPVQTENGQAFHLLPAFSGETSIVEIGTCASKDFCQSDGIYSKNPDGSLEKFEKFVKPIYSPDGSRVAFLNPDAGTKENYNHIWYLLLEDTQTGPASRRVLYFPEESGFMVYPEVKTYAFSPDSSKLFILYNVYSEYFRYSLRLQTYLWDLDTGILYDRGKLDGVSGSLSPRLEWSPDGKQVFFFLTDVDDGGKYHIHIYETSLADGTGLDLFTESLLESEDYLYLTNLYWR